MYRGKQRGKSEFWSQWGILPIIVGVVTIYLSSIWIARQYGRNKVKQSRARTIRRHQSLRAELANPAYPYISLEPHIVKHIEERLMSGTHPATYCLDPIRQALQKYHQCRLWWASCVPIVANKSSMVIETPDDSEILMWMYDVRTGTISATTTPTTKTFFSDRAISTTIATPEKEKAMLANPQQWYIGLSSVPPCF